MNRAAVDKFCERGILALVLAILIFGPLAFGGETPALFLIIQGLAIGVALLWAVRLWFNPRPRVLWPPICWAALAFAAYAVLRYSQADIEYVARQELIRVLIYTLLFFAVINNLHGKESTQLIAFTLIFLAMLISCYAIYQFIANSDQVWNRVKPYPHRGSGTYICPNHLAGFLEMLLPLGLAYTLAGRLSPVARILLGYASFVILAGIGVSTSRGGWLSTAVALLLLFGMLATQRAYRLPALALFICLIVGGVVLVPKSHFFKARAAQVFEHGRLDDDTRFSLWGPAVQIWKQNPWWGAGPGHFDYRFRGYRPESVQLQPERAHNDFLNTLADWGLVGAGIIAAAWVLLLAGAARTWRFVMTPFREMGETRRSNKFAFVLGSGCGLAAIFAHSVVDFNMHIPANAILAICLMALLSSHQRFATDRHWLAAGSWVKAITIVLLAGGSVYLGLTGWRQSSELTWLDRASRAAHFSPTQVGLLIKASQIEPMNAETTYKIAEALRIQSLEGGEHYAGAQGVDYREIANRAMEWFGRTAKLNPWNGYAYLGQGWCLDWLEKKNESPPYFAKAEQLDPNGYYTLANLGLHYVESGDFLAGRTCFERSLRLEWFDNPIPRNYLELINRRLLEATTNQMTARSVRPYN